jgi:NitT/TauT family transport system ATP-binding protein
MVDAQRIPSERPILEFRGVTRRFMHDRSVVVAPLNVDLTMKRREFTTVIGPSGCGKTTLLRMAAGLLRATEGQVLYDGAPVTDVNRRVGFVTQDSKLFPWLTLYQNVEFALRIREVPRAERERRVTELIAKVGLSGFEKAYPYQLSGGMQKRASIARTLIYEPETMLMDEPFGPLDAQTRLVMQQDLLNLWTDNPRTILFITHDLMEAVALSDRVVVMTHRPGTVKKVFDIPLARPRDLFSIHQQRNFQDIYQEIWSYFRTEVRAA